ncbi:MAG TPA: AMP-binding protein [Vineibacter sp.]|nr:AMP-binding protein [Vineibacter sp.]
MAAASAHVDTFARDHLPPPELCPKLDLSMLSYPPRLNAAAALLDDAVRRGQGDRIAFRAADGDWTYGELLDKANRIAEVLRDDLGLVPGNRVLLRGVNSKMLAACWFAVLKAGGIAVGTMPLWRARELGHIVTKAAVRYALCEAALRDELDAVRQAVPSLDRVLTFGDGFADGLEARMEGRSGRFETVDTAADDVAIIAFTSGTTGPAKGTMHFHRDLLATCDTFGRHVLRATPDDIFIGSPPFAFTFGLGALILFPMRIGASTALPAAVTPPRLLEAILQFGATVCWTAPTAYRVMAEQGRAADLASLRLCVSAGEPLPLAVFEAWRNLTGLRIIDGIGATEMLHIFIACSGDDIRPGATGRPVPGYSARIVDEAGNDAPPAVVGRLAVQGPTGCRYLDDPERQRAYVRDGWNLTGDAYLRDADGYFWYQARTDDMIVSAGYNISGLEVENVLLEHADVRECAVVGVPDPARGMIVKAYVVPRDPASAGPPLVMALQQHVKAMLAPYKYPRAIEFLEALPRTANGKVQRVVLRQRSQSAS